MHSVRELSILHHLPATEDQSAVIICEALTQVKSGLDRIVVVPVDAVAASNDRARDGTVPAIFDPAR